MTAKRTLPQDHELKVQKKLLGNNVTHQSEEIIKVILKTNLDSEISFKEKEIDLINEKINEVLSLQSPLIAGVITKYYANFKQKEVSNEQQCSTIHPAVKKYMGKSPKCMKCSTVDCHEQSHQNASQTNSSSHQKFQSNNQMQSGNVSNESFKSGQSTSKDDTITTYASRCRRRCKVFIGNTSKYIPLNERDESDQSSHKWMVYVRGDKDQPNIQTYVKKVRFLLHPSYSPSDVIEVCDPPFYIIKRGWGEFPLRVQLYFHDCRNKPVTIVHDLKLDKSCTAIEKLGAETVVELQIFKPDESIVNSNNSFPLLSPSQCSLLSSEESTSAVTCNGAISSDSFVPKQELNSNIHIVIKKEPNSPIINTELPETIVTSNSSFSSMSASQCTLLSSENSTSAVTRNDSISDSFVQKHELNSNIHTAIKKESNSPIINTELPEIITNCQTSNVNNCKIILTSNDSFKSSNVINMNSEQTVPKSEISNRVTIKCSTNSSSVTNEIKTAIIKCRDSKGNLLKVPLSVITFKSPQNLVSQTIQARPCVDNISTDSSLVSKTVPSYFMTLAHKQNNELKQRYAISLVEKETVNVKTDTDEESKNASVVRSLFKKNPHLFYQFELESIKLEYCKTFEDLLKRVCKIFPLVKKDVDQSVLTFCAKSLEEFHTWNIGKQRASEWRRASKVRKSILQLLNKKGSVHITPDSVWSQRNIMTWYRKNGFVPMPTEKMTPLPEPKWADVELCSLNNADDIISSLQEEKYTPVVNEDEEEIDIIDTDRKPSKTSVKLKEGTYLPHASPSAAFVKHTASELGIYFKPVELEPGLYFPLVEEVLLSAVKEFVVDIVGASLNEGFNRNGGKISPEEVTVSDVYSALKNIPKFDWCTNNYLGLPKDSPESTSSIRQ